MNKLTNDLKNKTSNLQNQGAGFGGVLPMNIQAPPHYYNGPGVLQPSFNGGPPQLVIPGSPFYSPQTSRHSRHHKHSKHNKHHNLQYPRPLSPFSPVMSMHRIPSNNMIPNPNSGNINMMTVDSRTGQPLAFSSTALVSPANKAEAFNFFYGVTNQQTSGGVLIIEQGENNNNNVILTNYGDNEYSYFTCDTDNTLNIAKCISQKSNGLFDFNQYDFDTSNNRVEFNNKKVYIVGLPKQDIDKYYKDTNQFNRNVEKFSLSDINKLIDNNNKINGKSISKNTIELLKLENIIKIIQTALNNLAKVTINTNNNTFPPQPYLSQLQPGLLTPQIPLGMYGSRYFI